MDSTSFNDIYVSRLPTPPRIVVPPPSLGDQSRRPRSPLPSMAKDVSQWTYKDRHAAQAILPYLYLGPTSVGKEIDFLQQNGITMMLALRHARPIDAQSRPLPAGVRVAGENGLITNVISVYDNQSLIAAIPSAIACMNKHITTHIEKTGHPGKTLICCDSGNDRSPALAVAYLMECLKIDLITAIQHVQSIRFCANIDDEMKQTLRAFEDLAKARRDIGQRPLESKQSARKLKRGHEEDQSAHDSMDVDNLNESVSRKFAPFGEAPNTKTNAT